jgi:hypothetical protein
MDYDRPLPNERELEPNPPRAIAVEREILVDSGARA